MDHRRSLPHALSAAIRRGADVLRVSLRDFLIDDGPHWSAAIAFYAILSIFPLLLAAVAIAGYFVDPQWAIEKLGDLLRDFIPRGEETIRTIVEKSISERGQIGVFAILVLLWSGTRVFSVLVRALNVAYDVDEVYGFGKRLLVELGMLLSAGLLFIGALLSGIAARVLDSVLAVLPQGRQWILATLGWLLPFFLLMGAFFCLYRFVPRNRCHWKSALIGAIVAAVTLFCARPLFTAYLDHLGSYGHIYGWLAIGIILLVWAYIAALITLFAGELVSHIQMMVLDGRSSEEVTRLHQTRSPRKTERS